MTSTPNEEKYLRVDVKGNNAELWKKVRATFTCKLEQLLNTIIDDDKDLSIRETAKGLISGAFAHLNEKMAKAGLENDRIGAEVERIYADIQETLARTKKTRAEAALLEQQHTIKQLRLSLITAKMLFVKGDDQDDALLFSRDFDSMMQLLDHLE